MFNLSGGEVVVLILLGLIFFGPSTLPELRDQVFARASRSSRRAGLQPGSWGRLEWLLMSGILVLTSLVIALVATRRQ